MQELIQYQINLLKSIDNTFFRYLYPLLTKPQRLIAIKGLRGTGKTTLLLQLLKYHEGVNPNHLYATLEHPFFYNNSLFDFATEFYETGGRLLLLDEVHKYPNWSREIKLIYDGYPELRVIFTSSSALDILAGEADLSRRAVIYELHGLSYREFIQLFHGVTLPTFAISDILNNHYQAAVEISGLLQPLSHWKAYLEQGYFPFGGDDIAIYKKKLGQVLELTLAQDLNYVIGHTPEAVYKMKRVLGMIAQSAPYTVNISNLADRLEIGRNTVKTFLYELNKAGILNFLSRAGKGISPLQKPDRVYLENTNLSHLLQQQPDGGNLRETFFINQLYNAGLRPVLPPKGDFKVEIDGKSITFEIGGKRKSRKQLQSVDNGYIVKDDIQIGIDATIPLWLFGMMY